MPTAKTQIKFKYGLQENYTKLTAKDANTLYFRVTSKIMNSGTITFEELAHMYNFYNPEEYLIPSEEQKNIEWRGTSAFFIVPGTHTLWAIEYHRTD